MSINVDLSQIKSAIVPAFWDFMSVKERYCVLRGGRYSGKSHACAQKLILRCLLAEEKGVKHKFLCLRKTAPSVRESVFALIKFYIVKWNLLNEVTINKTEMKFFFNNGCEIHCSGIDDPEKVKSYEGITGGWLEEATEMTLDDIRSFNMIMRGETDYRQILLSFNPVSKNNWIYLEFFTEANNEFLGNTFFHHSTYADNPFVDEQTKQTIDAIAESSDWHRKVWKEGIWAVREGLVYDNWGEVDTFPNGIHVYGLDFGFTAPTTVVKVHKAKQDIYAQELLYQTGLTNMQLIGWIKDHLPRSAMIIADSAQPERIKEAQLAGIKMVGARKEKESVMNGIDYLQRHRINLVKPSPNLKNEISGYIWKSKKPGKAIPDEPVMVDDHLLDALRYAVWTKWGYHESSLQIVWI